MKVIHKTTLKLTTQQVITLPMDAQMLSVAEQHGVLQVWYETDTDNIPTENVTFVIVGTGHPLELPHTGGVFLGTVVTREGALVWHVYHSRG